MLERPEYVALLRELRGRRSLDEVAAALGTRRQQLILWEKLNGTGPGPEYAAKLADYYGDERLRRPPKKGNGIEVSDAGLVRLLELLREAVDVLERSLGDGSRAR